MSSIMNLISRVESHSRTFVLMDRQRYCRLYATSDGEEILRLRIISTPFLREIFPAANGHRGETPTASECREISVRSISRKSLFFSFSYLIGQRWRPGRKSCITAVRIVEFHGLQFRTRPASWKQPFLRFPGAIHLLNLPAPVSLAGTVANYQRPLARVFLPVLLERIAAAHRRWPARPSLCFDEIEAD